MVFGELKKQKKQKHAVSHSRLVSKLDHDQNKNYWFIIHEKTTPVMI